MLLVQVALLILGVAPRIAFVSPLQEYPGYTDDIPDTEVPEALPSTEARKKPDTEIPDHHGNGSSRSAPVDGNSDSRREL
jgi:hypothetical protein